jgi:hypothetical protein
MSVPTPEIAETLLAEAAARNPGPWVDHSRNVALAGSILAGIHPQLEPQRTHTLGLLHDIGRREGPTGMRHVLDGYHFLLDQGYHAAACICLTHSFPIPNTLAGSSKWDCRPEEIAEVQAFLDSHPYDDYDRLFQLCDSIALANGFCLLETRWVDVLMRYQNYNEYTLPKWQAIANIKRDFDKIAGQSIYRLLPGLAEQMLG